MKEREALRLALEALKRITHRFDLESVTEDATKAITAAEKALAQPEQEPVAWANRVIGGKKWLSIHASKGASDRWLEYRIKEQAQGEEYEQVSLYTTPPQRTWVGLTDEEVRKIAYNTAELKVAKAIEAKLKEKNDC